MSSKKKPFEQYSSALPDGRRVVEVVVFEPRQATMWIAASGKSEALRRARDFGAPEPHVVSHSRPGGPVVDAAGDDPDGGVFVRGTNQRPRPAPLPISELRAYLDGSSRAF